MTLEKLQVVIEAYTKPYRDELEKVKAQTKQATGVVETQTSKMRTAFSKVARIVATALSVVMLVSFANSCIDLGSRLQEVQNVVDVTFGSMNTQVNAFAKNAITQFGLSELAAKQYIGTYGAMAKAFGVTGQAGYEMSAAITGLTGDVASFYNLSSDEAYTKLKSIFTGETESLKDLGVVMTQTALDQYALNNGFGKTTSAMTEQEKVMLRYQFVLSSLGDASGDFMRTSDSWANQTKVLSLQFDQLKATIGQGLINALTPVVKIINEVVARLQVMAETFRAFTQALFGNAGSTNAITSAAEASDDISSNMGSAASSAGKMNSALGIDELNIVSEDSASGSTGTSGTPSYDNMIPGVDELIPEVDTSKVEEAAERIRSIFENIKETMSENSNTIAATTGGMAAGIGTYLLATNWGAIVAWITTHFGAITTAFSGLAAAFSAPALIIAAIVGAIVAIIIDLWNTSESFRHSMGVIWGYIKDVFVAAYEMIWTNGLKPLLGAIIDLGIAIYGLYEASGIKTVFEMIITVIVGAFVFINGTVAMFMATIGQFVLNTIQFIIEIITALINTISWACQNWEVIWATIGKICLQAWQFITEAFVAFDEYLTGIFQTNFTESFGALGEILNVYAANVENIWNAVKKIFEGIMTFIEGVFTCNWEMAWQGIQDIFAGVFDGLLALAKAPINGIIGLLNIMIEAVNFAIREINKLSFVVPEWIPGIGGQTIGFDLPEFAKIPYLAGGGIVSSGQLFVANEAGPELVGSFGSRTGVINNKQIVDSVSSGVAAAVASVFANWQGGGSSEPITINLVVDGRTLATVTSDTKKRAGYNFKQAKA